MFDMEYSYKDEETSLQNECSQFWTNCKPLIHVTMERKNKKRKKKSVSFVHQLEVHATLNVNDMTRDEIESTWYSKHELDRIRVECDEIVQRIAVRCSSQKSSMVSSSSLSSLSSTSSSSSSSTCCWDVASCNSDVCCIMMVDYTKDEHYHDDSGRGLESRTAAIILAADTTSPHQDNWIRSYSIDAVLNAQCEEWEDELMMLKTKKAPGPSTSTNGGYNNGCHRNDFVPRLDFEDSSSSSSRILEAYRKYSTPCQQVAYRWGLYDEMVASMM